MGEALLSGLLRAGWATAAELAVVERLPDRAAHLRQAFPGVEVSDRPVAAEGAVIAVKPGDVDEACKELALAGVERVLSIAAGVSTGSIEAALDGAVPVVRAMPNTPAVIGRGVAAIAPGASAGEADLEWAASVLEAVGVVVRVKEPQLDAVTGLSGSGPAYVFLVAESLIEAGVLVGLPREVAEVLAVETIIGSGELFARQRRARGRVAGRGDVTRRHHRGRPPRARDRRRARCGAVGGEGRHRAVAAPRPGLNESPGGWAPRVARRHFRSQRTEIRVSIHARRGVLLMPSSTSRARFLTVAEVAQMMRVSTMTVYRLIKAGELASARVGKSYRIREEDVDAYLAKRYTEAG